MDKFYLKPLRKGKSKKEQKTGKGLVVSKQRNNAVTRSKAV